MVVGLSLARQSKLKERLIDVTSYRPRLPTKATASP
jgi:hypothetical protein